MECEERQIENSDEFLFFGSFKNGKVFGFKRFSDTVDVSVALYLFELRT